jgi:hypothetical protein
LNGQRIDTNKKIEKARKSIEYPIFEAEEATRKKKEPKQTEKTRMLENPMQTIGIALYPQSKILYDSLAAHFRAQHTSGLN